MVKITRGDHQLMVPLGAYYNYYESQGYELLENAVEMQKGPGMFTGEEANSPNNEHSAASETYTRDQVASMTTDQLYEVADHLGIDYQKVRTKGDLIELITRAL